MFSEQVQAREDLLTPKHANPLDTDAGMCNAPYEVISVDGDKLVIRPEQEAAVQDLVARVREDFGELTGGRLVGAVSGRSGAGKSEVSHMFRQRVEPDGIRVLPYSADHLYWEDSGPREERRKREGVQRAITYDEYDWRKIGELVRAFREGGRCTVPHIDMSTKEITQREIDCSQFDMLLFEGLYAAHPRVGADFTVMVEQTDEKVIQSQVVRGKELWTGWRKQVVDRENELVAALAGQADYVITPHGHVVRRQDQ